MAVNYEVRHAAHPEDAKHYTTEEIEDHFLVNTLFTPGDINIVYSHYDRAIVGGATPQGRLHLKAFHRCGLLTFWSVEKWAS